MNELKRPIGQSDFCRIIQARYYLVDESLFIRDTFNDYASAILITPSRPFGKDLKSFDAPLFFY
jgi:hypothetical protein